MKTKILIPFLALAVFGLVQSAEAQFDYTDNGDGTCTIEYYAGSGGVVVIPSVTNGLSVVSIGESVFQFTGSAVTSITIPDSVTNIEDQAFFGCTSLTNITVDTANPAYSSTNGVLFDKDQTTLIQFPTGLGGSYTIPDSVTNIGEWAFFDCTSLTNIAIPDSVTSIGDYAFVVCGLTSIVIPDSVTSIGDYALGGCYSLTSVTIPDSVTNIGDEAFQDCYSLTSITIPDSVTSIGGGAFEDCISLTNISIGSGVTSIGDVAFYNCPLLTSVTFLGNAPTADSTIFDDDNVANITVYTAPGTTGWANFASVVGVVTAPQFGSAAYGGSPVLFYPTNGAGNTLQLSTNPASGNWVTVSNAVTLAALQLTNPPPTAFFRLQSSGSNAPDAGLALYGNLPVLFYPTNSGYTPQMATSLAAPDWTAPSGNAFISVQVTNAPPGAVFRLH